jgi:hypothetical protein
VISGYSSADGELPEVEELAAVGGPQVVAGGLEMAGHLTGAGVQPGRAQRGVVMVAPEVEDHLLVAHDDAAEDGAAEW